MRSSPAPEHRPAITLAVLLACVALVAGCGGEEPPNGDYGDDDAMVFDVPEDAADESVPDDVADETADDAGSDDTGPDVPLDVGMDVRADVPRDGVPMDVPRDVGLDAGVRLDVPRDVPRVTMRVVTYSLPLRASASTSASSLASMPCGSQVVVLGGPSGGWYRVQYGTRTGYAQATYLVAESAYRAATCTRINLVAAIFQRARLGVGYSYWWGHGCWRDDGRSHGSCSGSCPSCSHSGSYGADCSGFVAKAWQVPSSNTPISSDRHPYSTYNFRYSTTHWSRLSSRSAMQPADALVYNSSGRGHIVLFESGRDPWGSIWTYEARGCSYGIVHNLRTAGSAYVPIRREGL